MASHQLITLTTDFGLEDAYVGIMKGVLLDIAPGVTIVDISHQVPPQRIATAAYLLRSAYRFFSRSTVHVAVVDPGVGTDRRPIAIQTPVGSFVGPDNGVFAGVLEDAGLIDTQGHLSNATAVQLDNPQYMRRPVSNTFHGRDIFAPVAAHLARGIPLLELGQPVSTISCSSLTTVALPQGLTVGEIVHIDHFGNAITNIGRDAIPPHAVFEVGDCRLNGLATNYQEAPIVALIGSEGVVEIAARNGSAAAELGIRVGDQVMVRSGD